MITKIALAAALVLGTASVALADIEFDANLQNRYPQAATQTFQTSNVALTGGQIVVASSDVWSNGGR
jgi:hypothetical protein